MPEPLIPSEAELERWNWLPDCEMRRLIASLRLLLEEHRAGACLTWNWIDGKPTMLKSSQFSDWQEAHTAVERALQPTEVSRG